MELPDWIVDDVLVGAKPASVRLVISLFRHGHTVTDNRTGGQRAYWKGSHQSLCRVVGVGRTALIEAEAELAERGALVVHAKARPKDPHAVSAPYDRPSTSLKFGPVGESDFPPHDGGVEIKDLSLALARTITTIPSREKHVITALLGYEVSTPKKWVSRFGVIACERAIANLRTIEERAANQRSGQASGYIILRDGESLADAEARERRQRRAESGIRNPAGLLYSYLTGEQSARGSA